MTGSWTTTKDRSLLAKYDEVCRGFGHWMNNTSHIEFQTFAQNQEACRLKWLSTEERCMVVLKELNEAKQNKEKLELQVRHVTELLKNEIHLRQQLQKEEKELEKKLNMVKQIVSTDRNITDATRDKLVLITSVDSYSRCDMKSPGGCLIDSTSEEIESSTRSILSSLDITISEKTDDDLELSTIRSSRNARPRTPTDPLAGSAQNYRKRFHQQDSHAVPLPQPLNHPTIEPAFNPLHNKSVLIFPAKTTSPMTHQGVIREGGSPGGIGAQKSLVAKQAARNHNFATKVILKPETCIPCATRIRFGKSALRCIDCCGTCHVECVEALPPCVATTRPPNNMAGKTTEITPKNRISRSKFFS